MSSNIVVEWLRSLHLGQYAESFIDNGYDDLEICKQVGDPDLDAIGVFNPSHRNRLLQSVRTLREEGAASVYFTLEETAAIHEECQCDSSSARSSRTSSGHQGSSDKEHQGGQRCGTGSSPASSSAESAQELGKYLDEYEEGKAELVKIPRIQLKLLLKEKLGQDGIRLSCQPYSTAGGDRGYLEGLASRYADLFTTHYGDVLEHLEELRRREWDELSPRIRVLVGSTPGTPPDPAEARAQLPSQGHGLTTSHSQPIYVPGKYSPSSCLSDKEEDEIYGFGYGVYGKQMLQRQQQHKMIISPQVNYQSCLSPRSAYFYEFPPNQQSGVQTNKKKTSFSRFLRGLKTHRKDKHSGSPRHGRASRPLPMVATPDAVAESMLPSIVDPRDYDRLRFMQMNGSTGNSFEETIHRLKVQEFMKKRERFTKEHEEILRDIQQGLLQSGREGRPTLPGDDTYMYDDDARCSGVGQHWYDEPPYESDPEDFLMGTSGGQAIPAASIQNGRVCFTLNLRSEPRGEGVISLRTAGDISIPRDPSTSGNGTWLHTLQHPSHAAATGVGLTPRGSARRGLLVPQSGPFPATIITHRPSRDRESGDYAGSDVQSIGSRLSTISIDTSRSEQLETPAVISSPSYLSAHGAGGKGRPFHRLVGYTSRSSASEDGPSASQSSDYEDQEELESVQPLASSDGGRGAVSLVGRMRGLRQDVQRKISRLRASPCVGAPTEATDKRTEPFPSTSSVESLPSGSGSTLVPAGSNHSSLSAEDRDTSPVSTSVALIGPVIGKARALVDYIPSPYDKDALRFKKGDIIDIVAKNPSGLWRGVVHNRVGTFKFINVEVLVDKMRAGGRRGISSSRGKPQSVEELLQRINLEEHISVFVLNGYEDLELFKDLESEDLDYLGISNPEHRAKILTAVQLLHDYDSPESPEDTDEDGSATSTDDEDAGSTSQHSECSSSQMQHATSHDKCSSFRRLQFPRDSGCYDASLKERQHSHHHHHHKKILPPPGAVPHHHLKSGRGSSLCDKASTNLVDSVRTHQCGGNREIPNNLDSGLATLQHPLLHCGNTGGVVGGDLTGASNEPQFSGIQPIKTGSRQGSIESTDFDKQMILVQQQQQSFLPNIPVTSASTGSPVTSLVEPLLTGGPRNLISASSSSIRTDSYVIARGKFVSVESCRKNGNSSLSSSAANLRCSSSSGSKWQQVVLDSPVSQRSPSNLFGCGTTDVDVLPVIGGEVSASPTSCGIIEDSCETNPKLTMVKFVVGGSTDLGLGCESGNLGMGGGRGCCFSEKSSDSGVSSSSLSSANPRDNCVRKATAPPVIQSPTRGFINFGCVNNNRSSPTNSNNKSQGLVLQGSDKNSYQ